MFITIKKHKAELEQLREMLIIQIKLKLQVEKQEHEEALKRKEGEIKRCYAQMATLETQLAETKNLKAILEKLAGTSSLIGTHWKGVSGVLTLPDNVLVYVDDILGGKVIKQEGNKAIKIDKAGNVTSGLTKSKVDKGYAYKLVRE